MFDGTHLSNIDDSSDAHINQFADAQRSACVAEVNAWKANVLIFK